VGRALLAAGALLGFLGVGVGAFGAHAVRERIGPERLENWKTGADYQLWHALATIVAGFAATRWASGAAAAGGWCFVAGTVVFSGSLYALALTGRRKLGAITPVGGLLFLLGWGLLLFAAFTA
jgi:uncharacterized membrane protein YgdD (TMEM256/DUF423 family)